MSTGDSDNSEVLQWSWKIICSDCKDDTSIEHVTILLQDLKKYKTKIKTFIYMWHERFTNGRTLEMSCDIEKVHHSLYKFCELPKQPS